MYFHGNAEDGGHSYFVNQVLLKTAKAHVVTVEYPGYGIYEYGSKFPNEKLMFWNADKVYEYLTTELEVPSK